MSRSTCIAELAQASDGLLFQSESDFPLRPFQWPSMADPPAPAALLQFLGLSANTPVEVVQLEDFFRPALMDQQWHGPAERETVARFSNLVITLHKHLDDLKVYKIGRIRIDVFIIGKTRDDGIAGLITKVVET